MINQTISHYRITGQLGSGGMGVVYEAQDLTLGRRVALKFLPPEMLRDQTALDRFLFEARTASTLNHPNICTIYAVEKAGDQSFIAMELLEGQNLDQRLGSGPLPLDRLLDVGIQLADALDAAHSKNIIHRDIKPANIFLVQRGQVKILDFGLAKLARPEMAMETIGATLDAPNPAHLTSPGATVGTIAYMSPEQARGETLDTRTDLFSLGSVIYQMATGRLPFSGHTSAVIFHAILELDPPSAVLLNPALPPKLQEIIEKALEKDLELRYQSAADLRSDLKRLKRDTESGRKPSQPVTSAGATMPAVSAASSAPTAAARSTPAASRVSSSSAVISAARRNKLGVGLSAVLVLGVAAAAAYGLYAFVTRSRPTPFQNISVTKVTDGGKSVLAAISPDGNYILHLVRENGLASLWLRNVPTNSNTQVEPPADLYYLGLRFSPDGNYLYFERSEPGNTEEKYLYRAPLFGGTPQKLVSDIDSNITFSPEGKKFAFMRYDNPVPGKYQLIVRSLDSPEETALASGPVGQALYQPAWSPDGKTIVCTELQPGSALGGLVAVDVSSGGQKVVFSMNDQIPQKPAWLPDGSGLVVLARGQSSNFNRSQIALVSYPDGKFVPITRDTNDYSDVSVAASGQVIATILGEDRWNLFVMPASSGSAAVRQLTIAEASTNFTWTRDNQLIADQQNRLNLINAESGDKSAIATEEGRPNGDPSACADGRYVVFLLGLHGGTGSQNVWRMDSSGGNLKPLTNGKLDNYPWCSPDGRWVYYIQQADQQRLAKVSIDGGPPQTVTDLAMSGVFDLSPDGKFVAFAMLEHAGEHKEKLALVSTDSGQVLKRLDFERPRFGLVRFSQDGKAVVYPTRDKGIDNLWLQPLDGSKGKQLTDFTSERIWDFHWSFDGSKLALVRGHSDADVVLIRDAPQ
jgi:serine/threonine protein kinase/sugar lactone lactonase YvrE